MSISNFAIAVPVLSRPGNALDNTSSPDRMKTCTDHEAAHIRSVLKDLEWWNTGPGTAVCPCCAVACTRKHQPDCRLDAALKITQGWTNDVARPPHPLDKGKWLG